MRGAKHMLWAAGITALIIVAVIVWFIIPYSPLKAEFLRLKGNLNPNPRPSGEIFAKADISGLPPVLQKYFENCGYIGKPRMFNIKMNHNDVDFILNGKALKIKCIQYNSGNKPERIALIGTSLHGIPFEGLDVYQNGIGSMKGMIAKSMVLFHQTGEAMNQSSLVNCLAESLLIPSFALQNFITWKAVDENRVEGTITYYGLSVRGIFTFDENGYLLNFTTNDRLYVDTHGNIDHVKWSAICGDYREVNGIMQPKSLKAVWHLPQGDLVYFNSHGTMIAYDVTE